MKNNLKRIIKSGWKGFRQQASFSVTTIFIMALAIFLLTSLFLFQKSSQFLVDALREKVDMRIYFDEELSVEKILEIKDELSRLPEIKNIEYVSKEDALQKFTARHENDQVIMESLQEVGTNPLLASLNIRAWEASQYSAISSFLDNSSFEDLITKVDYNQKKSTIEKLFSVTSTINKIGIIFSIVLALIAVLVTFNTIRLAIYGSKEEIETMRLVGASNWFIRGPFLAQGAIIGIFASFGTLLIFSIAVFYLGPKIAIVFSGFDVSGYFFGRFFLISLLQLVFGVGLGISSSWLAIRKYLKV